MLLFNFGVIGEDADGVEALGCANTFIGGEELLHRVGRVGAVVQDLSERGVASADSREGIAQRVSLLGGGITFFAERSNFRLELRRALFQNAEARGSGFEVVSGAVGIVARAHGRFEHVVLGGFQLA